MINLSMYRNMETQEMKWEIIVIKYTLWSVILKKKPYTQKYTRA